MRVPGRHESRSYREGPSALVESMEASIECLYSRLPRPYNSHDELTEKSRYQLRTGYTVNVTDPFGRVMSRDIADGFGQYIADTSHDDGPMVGRCLGIGGWCRW